jgi:hypothetical protein
MRSEDAGAHLQTHLESLGGAFGPVQTREHSAKLEVGFGEKMLQPHCA